LKTWSSLTVALVVASIGVPALAEFATWLPPAVREGLVGLVPPVAVALLLVAYFNWRERLKRRLVADDERDAALVRAA
jgi:hypothetical protein